MPAASVSAQKEVSARHAAERAAADRRFPPRWVRTAVKAAAARAGVQVRRIPTESTTTELLVRLLQRERVDVVLDVGANVGQFARELRDAGWTGRIVSFEPLAGPFVELAARTAGDPHWSARRMALGAESGTLTLHVAGNTESSSALPMESRHVSAEPHAAYVGNEEVEQVRLDDIAGDLLADGERAFLKLDVQGFEGHVLDGAVSTLRRTAVLQTELSLVALYAGQPNWRELVDRLEGDGLHIHRLEPVFVDPETGQLLQFDAVFVRDAQSGER